MKRDEILNIIKELALSQGFYGRLLEAIDDAPEEEKNEWFEGLEAQNFKDAVDLVLFLEA